MKNYGKLDQAAYERSVEKKLYHLPVPGKAVCSSDRFAGRFEREKFGAASAGAVETGSREDVGSAALFQAATQLMASGAAPLFALIHALAAKDMEERSLSKLFANAAQTAEALGLAVIDSDAFILPQGMPGAGKEGISSADKADQKHSLMPGAGEEEISSADKADKKTSLMPVFTVSVIGEPDSIFKPEKAKEGMDLIMAGYAGWYGSVKLADLNKEKLRDHFNSAFIEPLLGKEAALPVYSHEAVRLAAGSGVRCMHAAGEGGIFTAVWDLARRDKLGSRIWLDKILIRQETAEVCDFLNINPYLLMSQGVVIMAADHGQRVAEELATAGIPAAVIGYLTNDNDRVVINDDESRFLEPFRGDSFYKASGLL